MPGTRLAVEYVTIQGQMVSFLVRLEKMKEGGEWRLSARYDTCHGRPHLDVVNEKGELVLKRWMEEMDIGEAFGPLRPTPAHPRIRVPRLWISAYAGGFAVMGNFYEKWTSLTLRRTMKNINDVNRKTFRKILMRPMKTVPMPPCRNRRYFKTTVLEKDLHQLMMDLGFEETTGRSKGQK